MKFDYSKLRGRIVEKFGSVEKFAEAMGLSKASMSMKLNNGVSFTQTQIPQACFLLDIKSEEVGRYFFTVNVQKTEQV
ncbi:DUF739 family protein [Aerococcus urinaeequi]|uniref:DUF739 family protein n=1 Tax=Aerococcus urinaeequi TaxID=51665 RepID=UPI000845BCEE|nr:DUF739 family protein [Aerococcus urinaeequi]